MTLLRRLVLPFFALAAGASLAAPPPAPGVYVMRHLQKDAGDDPGLSTEGRANAERLAGWFGTDAPRAIYVSSTRRARMSTYEMKQTMGDFDRRLAEIDSCMASANSPLAREIEKLR